MSFKPECPIPSRPGFFSQMRINSQEEARQALMDSWSSPEHQIYNLMHRTCPKCQGKGYAVYRSRRQVVREQIGCDRCLGLGAIED